MGGLWLAIAMGVIRGSSYYTVVSGTWTEAESKAISLGGNLVTINDTEEQSFLIENRNKLGSNFDLYQSWHGLSDSTQEGQWLWSSGERVSFTNWHWQDPSNSPTSPSGEDYGVFRLAAEKPGAVYAIGKWGDANNIGTGNFLHSPVGIAEIPLSYFSVSDLTIEEGEKGKVTISRTGGTQSSQTLTLTTSDGTAVVGDDYGRKNKTLTFAAGETSKTVNIVSKEDSLIEGDETFTLTLSASGVDAVPAQISDGVATVTITDDDQPTYSITPTVSSINEGGEVRTNVSTTGVAEGTRLYWTISGKGIDANDFSAGALKGSRLVKSDGSITFAHTLVNDLTTEGTETLEIKLFSDWARTTQVGDTATVTINDTSIQQKSYYSIGDVQGYEGDTLYALVSRTGNINIAHTLSLSASNGTAFAGFDFVAPNSTVSFAAGESSKLVGIRTIEDSLVESDESFSLSLSSSSSGAEIKDGSATLTILNDDSNTTTNFYQTYNYSVDNSTSYSVSVGDIKSGGGSVVVGGSGNNVGNSSSTTTINVDYKFVGTGGADVLKGYSGENYGKDLLDGGEGADQLFGYRGADFLNGGAGDDELRAGNGRDIITGGAGGDTLYGGFGLNTFEDEADGEIDKLLFKSDQWEENWLYGTSGNSPNGEKADKIVELDEFDEIYVQGVSTSQLTYGFVEHDSRLGETLSGIGIYASGALEAVYVGDDLSLGQIAAMTQGIL